MLTSTYTLVALSVEQTRVRAALHALDEAVATLPGSHDVAPARAASLYARLRDVYDHFHWRKLDKFLIPALRRCDAAFDGLLRELEELSQEAARAMRVAHACMEFGQHGAHIDAHAFGHALHTCIAALRHRLEREEDELFPLARSVVGVDAWFAIANQMLAHDAYTKESRGEVLAEPLRRAMPEPDPYPMLADAGRRYAGLAVAH